MIISKGAINKGKYGYSGAFQSIVLSVWKASIYGEFIPILIIVKMYVFTTVNYVWMWYNIGVECICMKLIIPIFYRISAWFERMENIS